MGRNSTACWHRTIINYYAHLGGLGAGFLAVWLARACPDACGWTNYLHKVDPDAPFKRELAALDQLIAQFDLAQAAKRGPDLLNHYPGRLPAGTPLCHRQRTPGPCPAEVRY